MSIELTAGSIIGLAFNLLMGCLAFFARHWIKRQQEELDLVRSQNAQIVSDFHAYQLESAMRFAQKTEVNDGKKELMEALSTINSKIDRLTEKLNMKADKQ